MKKKIFIAFSVVSTLAILLYSYRFQHFSAETSSMSTTIFPQDIVLVDKTHNSFNEIKRNNIYTFYFPLGDTIIEEFRNRYYEQFLRDYALELNISIDKARSLVYNNYNISTKSLNTQTPYIFRAVAVAGDKLEIKNAQLYINDELVEDNENIQYNYKVATNGNPFNETLLRKKKITFESLHHQPMDKYGNITMTLSKSGLEKLKLMPNVKTVEKIIKPKGYHYVYQSYPIFPNHKGYGWSVDNFGPITLPKKGGKIKLTLSNLPLYKRIIKVYEKNELRIENNQIYINKKLAHTYTFNMNYYFVMGDNRYNALDSRFWGFVPENHIIGEFLRILYSPSA